MHPSPGWRVDSMKLLVILMLAASLLSGCVVVPARAHYRAPVVVVY